MHVRVRQCGKPETIVVVNSKLTKIDEFRRLVHDKFGIEPNAQRLFYGGKVLENGYSFHDYNIKLNDVIQLMIKVVQPEENVKNAESSDEREGKKDNTADKEDLKYDDAVSKFYQIGDLVDIRERLHGAWFEGRIVRIVRDPEYVDTSTQQQNGESSKHFDTNTSPKKSPTKVSKKNERKTENSPNSSKVDEKSEDSEGSPKTPKRRKGITDYFNRTPKSSTKNDAGTSDDKNALTNGHTVQKKGIIAKEPQLNTDVGLLYKVHFEEEDDSSAQYCKLEEVRPRARTCIAVEDLKVGQKVMVNHNTEELHEKGYWYDFTLTEVKKLRKNFELIGTLYLGSEGVPQSDTKVRVNDKIYKIEQVIPLNERSEEEQRLMITSTEKRPGPLNCTRCRDDAESLCKECGCFLCAGKQDPDKIILCDECNNGYHMFCLTPAMEQLPEEDWYCPDCKRDSNSVIAPGAAKQAKKSNQAKTSRDWGRGMACVGKTQTCSMPANHFGPIPGVEVGMAWRFRIQLSESGVHRPPVSGIHGRDVDGAYSLVLSGGYEDDVDNGFEFTYTGSGGRDLSGNKRTADQSSDQTLTRENKALARNCAVHKVSEEGGDAGEAWKDGRPVRVVRSYKMMKHFPKYAPHEGIRYDGIYKVVKYYPETGKSGFRVWKYLLRRDDPGPAPWEKGGKTYPIIYPDGYLEAEAEKRAQKEKKNTSTPNSKAKKRVLRESNTNVEDDHEVKKRKILDSSVLEDSPPSKKRKTRSSKVTDSPTQTLLTPKRSKAKKSLDTSMSSPQSKEVNPFTIAKGGKSPKVSKSPGGKGISKGGAGGELNAEEKSAIGLDTPNAKLWKQCMDVFKEKGKKQFISEVTQLFLCIICQEVAANPVTTKCHHNFCMSCLKLAFKSTGVQTCSHCRQDLSKEDMKCNESLKHALRTLMPGYDIGKK